jgi:enterochelin esterase family protein
VISTFDEAKAIFKEIRDKPPEQAQKQADQLWQTLVESKRVPLVLGTQIIFLYKGNAEQVTWSGAFNRWSSPGLEGTRLGQTDLWVAYLELPEASRVEYKIILNGKDWILDSANPNTAFSGLSGANNVLTLPGFTVSDESQKREDIEHGILTEELSLESASLGYTVTYWVYTPAGYENLEKLPVIYILDGNDFIDERMGALPDVLDNLIADGRIEPVLAVFINQRDPGNPEFNRREEEFLVHPVEHANFVAEELVPVIDRSYRTGPNPDSRVIMGVSYGGLSSIFIAAFQPDVFHELVAFSPSLWALYNPEFLPNESQKDGLAAMKPALDALGACGGENDNPCPPINIFVSAGWPDWDVGNLDQTVMDLKRRGFLVEFHSVREGHTWDHWRGLSDEMLTYFFGSD